MNTKLADQVTSIPLRIWPAVLLLSSLWFVRTLPSMMDVDTTVFMASVFVPLICSVLILVWWAAFSRATAKEKAVGITATALIAATAIAIADKSMQGFGVLMYVVPGGMTTVTLSMILGRKLSSTARTTLVILAALIGFGTWDLVRNDGVWGDFRSSRSWRWTPTSEDLFLASLKSRKISTDARGPALGTSISPWPSFRGAERNGVQPEVSLAENWKSTPPRERWRSQCGPGWSSFSVAGNQLFTQEQRGTNEVVVCYDTETGREIWATEYPSRFWEAVAGPGPRATPTFHEGKVYALGAEGIVHRMDAMNGTVEWQTDLRDIRPKPPTWGFSSSPLIFEDLVIVHAGGPSGQGIVAFDIESGQQRWSAPSGDHSYSSPQLMSVGGNTQLLMLCNEGLTAYDPTDGEVVWKHEWPYEGYRVLQPLVVDKSSVLLGTGMGTGTRRIDLIQDDEGNFQASERWTTRDIKPDYNDFVAHDGYLYGFDKNIFACVDLKTGERRWKKGRYGHGQVLLLPNAEQLLVLSESGELVLLRTNPEQLEELSQIQVLNSKTWNHPVLIGNRLYVRNGEEIACFEMPLQSSASQKMQE
ncbi:MAG: PQQ-like beta-propeller repeat protein [Pirellulaceae bacterium]|nr:PQQ-like beta-propeller repeat protein [Pirellulaceae bacterium]